MASVDLLPPRSSLLLPLACLLLSPLLILAESQPPVESESAALLSLKDSLGDPPALSSWRPNSRPCDPQQPWDGIVCFQEIVTGLRLGGMGLSGKLDVGDLSNLHGLRTVSFINNNLSGPIPDLSRLQALKAIYISENHFSGEIRDDFFSTLVHLKKLWLSGNSFSGPIPTSISKLSHLMELHLENNQFAGRIPGIDVPLLASFNVSNNKLEGAIPKSLEKFDASAFAGNAGLCGPKGGGKPCIDSSSLAPSPATEESLAGDVSNSSPPPKDAQSSSKTILVFVVLLMSLLALFVGVAVVKKRREGEFDMLGKEVLYEEAGPVEVRASSYSSHKTHDSSSRHYGSSRKGSVSSKGGSGPGMAELVMVNETKGVFGLPDLMKAAAEVLGNGGLGSAYKALMSNGMTVVVKRMREMNRVGKDGFEVQMRRLGRLRHQNVLTPLAYHYRKEEKLLVLEYVEKGSLSYLLHGNRGPNHAALDWPTRLRIVKGIARGMAYLHSELGGSDVPHGNLKSGNVLIGPNFDPLLVDYGFVPLINPSQAFQTMFAYKSPESLQYRHVSPKSDVYCLGIVVIETLTGKFPSQYLNNGKGGTDVVQWVTSAIAERREAELLDPEILGSKAAVGSMERLLRVGATCAEPNPEQRLDLREAVRRIEEIAAEKVAQEGGSYPELTTRRSGREAVGQLSARRSDDDIGFAIS